jgi:hypothetical protein
VVDIPVYVANNSIGYIPAPNQSGKFLHRNAYRFNELSMGAGPFLPDPARFNLLLVGDSIVLGGNPLSEGELLGPQLEKMTGWQVWPVSAGSWTIQNELTYLRQHPEVLTKVDAVAFVLNSGDFGASSSWASDLSHPQSRPFPALPWLVRKYVVGEKRPPVPADYQVPARDWRVDLNEFAQTFKKPIHVFLYPDINEFQDKNMQLVQLDKWAPELVSILGSRTQPIKVADSASWTLAGYRDGIHPNGGGNAALGQIIQSAICAGNAPTKACAKGL